MKKLLPLLFAAAAFAEPLTIDKCVKMAKTSSHKIEMVREDVNAARAGKNEAFSYLLPKFALEGRYEFKNQQRDYSVFNDFGSAFSTKTIGVTGNLLLFDFFSTWNNYKAGAFGLAASEKNLDKALLLLEEEVKTAYYRVLETAKAVRVFEDSIRTLQAQRQTSQDYFTQGMIAKSDVLSVEVLIAERKKMLLRARNDQIDAQMALNRLINHELLDPLDLTDVTSDSYRELNVQSLILQALSTRNDRKALQAQIDSLEARYKAARAQHAPKFFAFGGYSFLENAPTDSHKSKTDQNWISGGIGMSLPLYEGGKTSAQSDKARAQLSAARAQLADLDTLVAMEVEKSYLAWQEQHENIAIEQAALNLAEENFRSISDRYGQGLVSINDVLKAADQLAQSQLGINRAIYRAETAYAHLSTVVGGNL